MSVEVLYTISATATGGGREGKVRTEDGALDLAMVPPRELGGTRGRAQPGTAFRMRLCRLLSRRDALCLLAGRFARRCARGCVRHRGGRHRTALRQGIRPDGTPEGEHAGAGQGRGGKDRRGRARHLPLFSCHQRKHRGDDADRVSGSSAIAGSAAGFRDRSPSSGNCLEGIGGDGGIRTLDTSFPV